MTEPNAIEQAMTDAELIAALREYADIDEAEGATAYVIDAQRLAADRLEALTDAQAALAACQQEVERLRKREAEWASAASYGDGSPMFTPDRLEQSIASMLSRNAELVKALEPFTQFFDKAMEGFTEGYADRKPEEKTVLGWNDANLLMADFNRARAALRPENEGE